MRMALRSLFSKMSLGILFFTLSTMMMPMAHAKSDAEIDASVDTALQRFEREVQGARSLVKAAKGILVLPKVIKGGIGIGGEYGEGALRINGKTVDYYNTVGGSFGFQLGAQIKDIYLLFMEETALAQFRQSEGWKAGVDGSVAIATVGANGAIDTNTTNQPVVAFVMSQKGLMYNLTLEGSKFNKLDK